MDSVRGIYVKYNSTVWAFVALVNMILLSLVVLTVAGKDASPLIAFITGSIMPCILLLINQFKADEIKRDVEEIKGTIAENGDHEKKE